MSEKSGAFKRDTTYLDGRITADGRDGWPVEPDRYRLVVARGCPWANRTMIVRRLLGLEDALSMGICGPTHDWRSWNFSLDPGQQDPVLRRARAPRVVREGRPRLRPGRHRPRDRGHPERRRGHRRLPAHHARPGERVGRLPPPRCPRPVPGPAARGDRGGQRARLRGRQQRRLPLRVRRHPAGLRRGLREAVRPPRLARRAPGHPPLPGRRHDHRGRRPALADPGPVRRGLRGPLQVQPEQADRDAGAVGLRPRPVPDPGVRRHDRLRPDQAALLPGAHQPQPVRHRPGRPGPVRLADPARPRVPARPPLRRRHPARPAARPRASPRRPHRPLHADR